MSRTINRIPPPLTDEQRAELDAWADTQDAPKVAYQVFDDSNITDEDYLGTEKIGPRHPDSDTAAAWAEKQGIEAWSVFRVIRCVTRDRKIWYMEANSPSHTCW